jgi:hypothetical protein
MWDEARIFEYLNDLRDSGVTNMFAAPSYLMDEFDMDKRTAFDWFDRWVKSFDG